MKNALKGRIIEATEISITAATSMGAMEVVMPSMRK